VKNVWRYLYSFWQNVRTWQTHRQTNTAWWHRPRLHSIARQKRCTSCKTLVTRFLVCVFTVQTFSIFQLLVVVVTLQVSELEDQKMELARLQSLLANQSASISAAGARLRSTSDRLADVLKIMENTQVNWLISAILLFYTDPEKPLMPLTSCEL